MAWMVIGCVLHSGCVCVCGAWRLAQHSNSNSLKFSIFPFWNAEKSFSEGQIFTTFLAVGCGCTCATLNHQKYINKNCSQALDFCVHMMIITIAIVGNCDAMQLVRRNEVPSIDPFVWIIFNDEAVAPKRLQNQNNKRNANIQWHITHHFRFLMGLIVLIS